MTTSLQRKCLETETHQFKTASSKPIFVCVVSGPVRLTLALIMTVALQCIIVFEFFFSFLGSCEQGRTEGWASRAAARGANP